MLEKRLQVGGSEPVAPMGMLGPGGMGMVLGALRGAGVAAPL